MEVSEPSRAPAISSSATLADYPWLDIRTIDNPSLRHVDVSGIGPWSMTELCRLEFGALEHLALVELAAETSRTTGACSAGHWAKGPDVWPRSDSQPSSSGRYPLNLELNEHKVRI